MTESLIRFFDEFISTFLSKTASNLLVLGRKQLVFKVGTKIAFYC